MHKHHHGQMFGALLARWIADIALQLQSVTRGKLKRLFARHHFRIDPRCARKQRSEFLGVAIVQIERAWIGIGFGQHDAEIAVTAARDKLDTFAGKLIH